MKRLLVAALVLVACKTAPTAPPDPVSPPSPPDPAPQLGEAQPPPTPIAKGNPRTDLIPRSVLFGNPERVSVMLSPNGKYLSWLAPHDGVMNVFVAPVDKLDAAKPVTNETARPLRQYMWAYDNKHLLYVQDSGGDENWHLWRTTRDGGAPTDLTPYPGARVQLIGTSWNHTRSVVVGLNDRDKQVSDVYELDIRSGTRKLLYKNTENMLAFLTDRDLNLRLARRVAADGSHEWFVRHGDTKWEPWQTVGFEDADTTNIVGFDATGKKVYMVDARDRETAALFEVDVATKKKRLLLEDAKADIGGNMLVHPTKFTLQAVGITYDRTRWVALDRSIDASSTARTIARDLDGLAKLADGGEASVNTRTLSDHRWLVAVGSDVSPPRYFLWDRRAQKGTFLFASQPALPTDRLAKMHPVIIKSRDGLDLVSYLTLPKAADPDGDGRPTAPVPMMLWVHGGPWGRNTWGFDREAQLLADRGYAVLQVNFRASAGFGKTFLNAGDRQWGKQMHDDLLDAVEWAIAHKITPRDKICIGGGSYGGYATLVGLAMTPDVFACGVDIVGPSNIASLLAALPPYWKPMIARFHRRMGNPEDPQDRPAMDAVSPLTHAAKIKRPLLIAQGANDPRVPQAESEQIVAAMQKNRQPVTYVLFPDEGHGFARPENNMVFMGVMEAFLSAHLGGTYLPLAPEELAASSMQVKVGKEGVPGL